MAKTFRQKFIADKSFYKMVLGIAVPIMLQNGVTNFVSLLDNIMVGQTGTAQMSSVAIVNQLLFVYNMCIFGGLSGAGIFTTQYYGKGDEDGVRYTMRFKFLLGMIFTSGIIIIMLCCGENLIESFLKGDSGSEEITVALGYGIQYMRIMLLGLPAFVLAQMYASTLRECGETVIPMKAGVAAVLINLLLNYLLIYGKFGFPELGVTGAAIATVCSRYLEAAIIVVWTHVNKQKNSYMVGVYSSLWVPWKLTKNILVKGCPLLLSEALWSSAITVMIQSYSLRGLDVVAAVTISTTVSNLFKVVYVGLGDSVAIVVGQLLGAGKMKEARDADNKMIAFGVMCCSVVAVMLMFVSLLFPQMYNTTENARWIASQLILIQALFMPLNSFLHSAYFTLRSGGKTFITFLFDGGFSWCVCVPIAFFLSRFTDLNIIWLFFMVQMGDVLRGILGFVLVRKGIWLNRIVVEKQMG